MLNGSDQRLAMQAYEMILDLILSRKIRPGDLLNERRMAQMLDMSRTPVRDGLLMLEAEGLLVRHGRRGLQVRQMQLDDFMDALQIRLLLEPAVARMATGRIDDSQLDEIEAALQAILADSGPSGTKIDREETRRIDERLHGVISDAAANPQLSSIILMLRRQTQFFDLKRLPERVNDTCREHLDIIAALRSGNGEDAAQAMTRHLDQVRASIIACLSRI